ncbi:M16 family metallopeptidase [Wolinella succinogenes]|uniref:PUTATIVE ZINC PROTEASE n=1 Tax=Wolinella succinogenes (strain ATCC 29543 / DSM 1740 / CCUG 13145 / JCM 31913 / LMG 7466 / NCTC 11488 / FDC 602W) TaxID=273121 RepID=Q7M7L7_WOLSU|nr:pitrilysin family protein [Wolinella succinogenes]CAE11208.1 PUTATIVE ZINC PROTEASE [Wolinella succinogenes]VEG81374.1 protease3 [Wolinella succinogenes]HCZ17996.1 insulinase family protein [Helicobacter sp.]
MGNSLPAYHEQTLQNGLKVVAIPLHNGTGVITTDIFYKVGSRNETMGKSGIAHMLEHLNFKSTKNLKAGEFDEIVKRFGGMTNASTGFDYTHYYIKSSELNLEKSLELFGELMEHLSLQDEEFQPERNVVAEERLWRTDNNPMGYLYFRLFNSAYVYHPYHWTPIGFMEDIKNWSIEDIHAFHKTYYQPQNAIIIVAGDIEPERVFQAAKERFERIENCCEIPKVHTLEPKQDGARRVIVKKESEVEMLALAYKIPPFTHEDQVALSAISEILSSGKSSRLQRNLIDKKRLANQVYAYSMDLVDEGVFLFMGIANEGVSGEALEKELLKQIEKIKEGKIKESEIEKIKINVKADFIFQLESSSSVASLFGSYLARGDLSPLLEFEEKFSTLTKEKIIEVANRYFQPDNSTTLILKK